MRRTGNRRIDTEVLRDEIKPQFRERDRIYISNLTESGVAKC